MPQKGWNVPTERPENRSEGNLNCKARSSSRDEFPRNLTGDEDVGDTHYKKYHFFGDVSCFDSWMCIPFKGVISSFDLGTC